MTPSECQERAAYYRAQAAKAGISAKRATVLTNISRTYAALATQLAMLIDDMKENGRQDA